MASIRDIAIEYGQQVEALLEQLGARGPARGAGELLDQVKHLINPEGLRRVRWFLRLRNKVVHGKPVEMPMPSWEQVDRAGRQAVGVLEGILARQRQAPRMDNLPANARQTDTEGLLRDGRIPARQTADRSRPADLPRPVYRIQERDGAYAIWVGPAGVWVVAEEREVLERARMDAEARLVARFPRLPVKVARRADRLEPRVRWGRAWLTPKEIAEAVRLLAHKEPVAASPSGEQLAGPPSGQTAHAAVDRVEQGAQPSGSTQESERLRRVALEDVPATFYVGPVGVLAVSEFTLIAETEAKRVLEDSKGAIPAIPVVRAPGLKAPQGRMEGVLALRDEAAIRDYLRGKRLLDDDEVEQVAGWLANRQAPVPVIRDKRGSYTLKGKEETEGITKAPSAYVVELVPPGPPPKPHILTAALRALSWRALFLPEMVAFAATGLSKPGTVDAASIVFVGVLVLRFIALFGSFSVWKFWTLLVVGALELLVVWPAVHVQARKLDVEKLLSAWYLMLILVPGLISFFRAIWLLLPQGVPLGGKQKPLPRRAAKETSSDRKRVR